mgnify:CR=1 FL=1
MADCISVYDFPYRHLFAALPYLPKVPVIEILGCLKGTVDTELMGKTSLLRYKMWLVFSLSGKSYYQTLILLPDTIAITRH